MQNEMLNLIKRFPEFILTGYNLTNKKCQFKKSDIKNIVYAGMGGSAIAGDILREILFDKIDIPFEVVRNYELPKYVNKNTLVIISSFSGNTEETISCMKNALNNKAKIIAISSNGKVEKISKKNNTDFIKIPINVPPRSALGITFFALLKKLYVFYCKDKNFVKEIENTVELFANYKFDLIKTKNTAKKLKNKVVFLYCDSKYSFIARRSANQLSENANHIAHFNFLPEMNHNEIVGMEFPKFISNKSIIIFIEFNNENKRIKKRISITKNILQKSGFEILHIKFEKKNNLFNILNAIIYFDLVSLYLSELNGVNAMEIKKIDILKQRMKK